MDSTPLHSTSSVCHPWGFHLPYAVVGKLHVLKKPLVPSHQKQQARAASMASSRMETPTDKDRLLLKHQLYPSFPV